MAMGRVCPTPPDFESDTLIMVKALGIWDHWAIPDTWMVIVYASRIRNFVCVHDRVCLSSPLDSGNKETTTQQQYTLHFPLTSTTEFRSLDNNR